MSWLFENPFPLLTVGSLASLILGFIWTKTGGKTVGIALLAVVASTAGVMGLQHFVVTEREKIENELDELAVAVESGDVEEIVAFLHASREDTVAQVRAEFPRYDLKSVRITQFDKIEIEEGEPLRAKAELRVVVEGNYRGQPGPDHRAPFFVELWLEKANDRWKVKEYKHHPYHAAIQKPEAR